MVQKLRDRIFLNYLTHTTQNKGQIRSKQNILAFVHIHYVGLEFWLSKLKREESKCWDPDFGTPGETILVVQRVKHLLRHPWVCWLQRQPWAPPSQLFSQSTREVTF